MFYIVKKGNTYRFFKKYFVAKLVALLTSSEQLVHMDSQMLETSCEDKNTMYITYSFLKQREIYRKAKRGWYYAGWYYIA